MSKAVLDERSASALARVKADYDPHIFFRSNNAAIAPAAGRSAVTN